MVTRPGSGMEQTSGAFENVQSLIGGGSAHEMSILRRD
jgi:hypothetical protein